MLADVGAGGGQGIVLADQAHSVGVAALPHQRDVAGDIHAGGAQGHAGHGVLQAAQAAVMENVLLIVIPEALEPHQHQLRGVDADGAVGGVHDGLSRLLDAVDDLDVRLTVQHFLHHFRQLAEADTAGDAFAAGLGMAQVQEVQRHVNGAQARRAGCDAPLHVAVKLVYHRLGLVRGLDVKTAHKVSLLI